MKIVDAMVVLGVPSDADERILSLCRSLGMDVDYAMQKSNPTERISSLEQEAVLRNSGEHIPVNRVRIGFMVPDNLSDENHVDTIHSSERDLVLDLLCWLVNRIDSEDDLPDGWSLLKDSASKYHKDFDPLLSYRSKGDIVSDGRLVIAIHSDNHYLQIPDTFQVLFPRLEGCRV